MAANAVSNLVEYAKFAVAHTVVIRLYDDADNRSKRTNTRAEFKAGSTNHDSSAVSTLATRLESPSLIFPNCFSSAR